MTGRDPETKKTITGVKLIEISLVDRPNNPDAVLTFWKSEGDPPMWQVERLARILADLSCLQQDAAWDTGDSETGSVPDELKSAISTLADLLGTMVAVSTPADDDVAEEPIEANAGIVDLAKVEDMISHAVAALTRQNGVLKAEIDAMKAEPALPKAILRLVSKAEDAGPHIGDGFEPVRNPDGSINEPATEMKKVHAAGPVRAG